jgi:pSer/pThr/pTyr-binding forkhead associated (FHA) protein
MDLFDLAILALRVALVVVLYVVLESGATNLKTGQLVVLHDGATLGRSETAGLALADPAVSAEHAQLVRRHGAWVVLDLGSTNGTLVNHELVDGQAGLQSGDVLGLGNVRLKVVGP